MNRRNAGKRRWFGQTKQRKLDRSPPLPSREYPPLEKSKASYRKVDSTRRMQGTLGKEKKMLEWKATIHGVFLELKLRYVHQAALAHC